MAECGFLSAKHIDRTEGFNRVKKRLWNCKAASTTNRRTRASAAASLRESAYYWPNWAKQNTLLHSLNTILRERFKVIEGVNTITDLETRELLNMVRTLFKSPGIMERPPIRATRAR